MNSKKGQGALIGLFITILVGLIFLIMIQTTVTNSAGNFTAGSIARLVVDNIVPIAGVVLLLGAVAYIGLGSRK